MTVRSPARSGNGQAPAILLLALLLLPTAAGAMQGDRIPAPGLSGPPAASTGGAPTTPPAAAQFRLPPHALGPGPAATGPLAATSATPFLRSPSSRALPTFSTNAFIHFWGNEPNMAHRGDTIIYGDNAFAAARSADGGATWTSPFMTDPNGFAGDPVLLADDLGVFHYFYLGGDGAGDLDLHYQSSVDDGNTWSAWKKVNDDIIGTSQDREWAAVDGSAIFVTYVEFGATDEDMRMVVSKDYGATWSPSVRMNDNILGSYRNSAVVDVDTNHKVHVAWGIDMRNNPASCPCGIYYTSTTDEGATFSTNILAALVNFDVYWTGPRRHSFPSIGVDRAGENVYLAYTDIVAGDMNVYLVRSPTGGLTWLPPVKLNDDVGTAEQFLPWLDIDDYGVIHVAWYDERNGVLDVFYTQSRDAGQTFSPNVRVNTGAGPWDPNFIGDFVDLDVIDGDVTIAWSDARDGRQDSYFARAPFRAELHAPAVNPGTGSTTTGFTYEVTWLSKLGTLPTSAVLLVDGDPYAMATADSDPVAGMRYTLTMTLPRGGHTYAFRFSDGTDTLVSPLDGTYDGPTVNDPPILKDPTLVPPTGRTDEVSFAFGITYQDLDLDVPVSPVVVINATPYALTVPPTPDYVVGAVLTASTPLPAGTYQHHFEVGDATHTVRFPSTGELPGPTVLPPNQPPVVDQLGFSPFRGNRSTLFTFVAQYRDLEDVAASTGQLVLDHGAPGSITMNMTPEGSTWSAGVRYNASTRLAIGPHDFHVEFRDDKFGVRTPLAEEMIGPVVVNEVPRPVITSPAVAEVRTWDDVLLRSASWDPDGDPLTESWTSDVDGALGPGREIRVRLTNATHNLTLHIRDDFGGTNETTVRLNVRLPIPDLRIDAIDSDPGEPIELDQVRFLGSARNAGDGNATDVDVTWRIDHVPLFRDTVALAVGFTTFNVSATWVAVVGIHTIQLLVGGVSFERNITVKPNLPPVAHAGPDQTVRFRGEVNVSAEGSGDPDGRIVSYLWDFGDGESAAGENASHVFRKAGTFTVRLTVTDNKGLNGTATLVVTVRPPPVYPVTAEGFPCSQLAILLVVAGVVAVVILRLRQDRAPEGRSAAPPIPRVGVTPVRPPPYRPPTPRGPPANAPSGRLPARGPVRPPARGSPPPQRPGPPRW